MARTGRPKSDNPSKNSFSFKMTDSELEKLNYCSEFYKTSRAAIIKKGINRVYSEIKK